MCLIFVALDAHPRYRLIVAANRDEFHSRPTAPLAPWSREDGGETEIVAGRDLVGGTWMGVTRGGRFSALTNYRDIAVSGQDPPSRGGLVSGFLNAESQAETYVQSLREHGGKYNGFSFLVYDGIDGYCYSNRADAVTKLTPGVHGLSNHLLNSPWPKVTRGVDAIGQHLVEDDGPTHLAETLFELLRDAYVPHDHALPDTGVGMDRERELAPMFVRGEVYGTRSSGVLLMETRGEIKFFERSFDAHAQEIGRVELAWHGEFMPA